MCSLQELKDSNEKEHQVLGSKIDLLNEKQSSIKNSNGIWKTLLGISVMFMLLFSGLGANYQRLTYEERIETNNLLDNLQDTSNIRWNKSKEIFYTYVRPHIVWSLDVYDSVIIPTEARSLRNEKLIMKYGIK